MSCEVNFQYQFIAKMHLFLCNTYRMLPDLIVIIGSSKSSNPKSLKHDFHKAQKHEKLEKNDIYRVVYRANYCQKTGGHPKLEVPK